MNNLKKVVLMIVLIFAITDLQATEVYGTDPDPIEKVEVKESFDSSMDKVMFALKMKTSKKDVVKVAIDPNLKCDTYKDFHRHVVFSVGGVWYYNQYTSWGQLVSSETLFWGEPAGTTICNSLGIF